MKINIAIDGPSAAGKSTIAKILANKLGYAHIDTGAMYRCVAYECYRKNIDTNNEDAIETMMKKMKMSFDENNHVYIDGEDVSKAIRENHISMIASKVSAYPKVRALLTKLQQDMAKDKGFIMDGRDIGSVVLPDAECKIYMIASVEARSKRRYDEYISKGMEANYDEIYQDIEKRDYQDTHREHAPLKKSEDAFEIDTSNMTIDEVVTTILKLIKQK